MSICLMPLRSVSRLVASVVDGDGAGGAEIGMTSGLVGMMGSVS